MADTAARTSDRPEDLTVGELVGRLSEQSSRLVHEEVALAKAELRDEVKHAGLGIGLFSGAGVLVLYGTGALVACAIAALALVVDLWLAALLVAVALFAVAGAAALLGKREVSGVGAPERTIASVKKDVAEIKGAR